MQPAMEAKGMPALGINDIGSARTNFLLCYLPVEGRCHLTTFTALLLLLYLRWKRKAKVMSAVGL